MKGAVKVVNASDLVPWGRYWDTGRARISKMFLLNIQAGRGAMPGMPSGAAQGTPNRQAAPEPVRKVGMYDNVGRNDPCPCGSGKKFKYCHYKEMQNQRQTVNPEEVKRAVPNRRRH